MRWWKRDAGNAAGGHRFAQRLDGAAHDCRGRVNRYLLKENGVRAGLPERRISRRLQTRERLRQRREPHDLLAAHVPLREIDTRPEHSRRDRQPALAAAAGRLQLDPASAAPNRDDLGAAGILERAIIRCVRPHDVYDVGGQTAQRIDRQVEAKGPSNGERMRGAEALARCYGHTRSTGGSIS